MILMRWGQVFLAGGLIARLGQMMMLSMKRGKIFLIWWLISRLVVMVRFEWWKVILAGWMIIR